MMLSRPLNPKWHALLLGVLRRAALGNLPFLRPARYACRFVVHLSRLLVDAMRNWRFFLLLAVLLLPSVSFAARSPGDPYLIGQGSEPCVLAGNCNSTDVVQSVLINQDVMVYGVACFLFFFGFQVGLGFMLGALHRQGGYRE